MIKIKDVIKTFDGNRALDNLNMHVPKGAIYGLVGPNGSGKTTVINHIVGTYVQDSGQVLVDSQNVYENVAAKQKIGYIQDDLYYFDQYTIKDMAIFYNNTYEKFSFEKFKKLESVFDIDVNKKIKNLSKGMKKQVAFWLVLSCNPELIVLDEPLDGLDPKMRRKVLKLMIAEVEKNGVTILVSSHNLRELEDVCDTVGFMDRGKMILEKKIDEMQVDIHKIQFTLKDGNEFSLPKDFVVKCIEKIGRVQTVIVKGKKEDLEKALVKLKPLFVDFLPLSLEEIFIYELGGDDFEVNKFII